jgi:hypothetical protein
MNAKRALAEFRAPAEAAAERRAWEVIRAVADDRVPARRRRGWRVAIVPAVVVIAGALALSPAGASVRRWIDRALGEPHPAGALFALPSPGRVLVSGSGGTWIVRSDGSTRRLGAWRQASWSPHGIFVAVASGDRLAVVDPRGTIRWTLARPAVSDPRWFSPTGYRVAYRSRSQLRVAAGDGTGDRLVAGDVAAAAPAWRPGHAYQLAYLTRHGILTVRDADTSRVLWTARAKDARALTWSTDGVRLLAAGRRRAVVYSADGAVLATVPSPDHQPILDASLSPDGHKLALILGGPANELAVTSIGSRRALLRRLLTGAGLRQLAWSPDQQWLLVSWPIADQWVFIRAAGRPRIAAVSRIAQQFQARPSPTGFPRLEGWCCTAKGAPG